MADWRRRPCLLSSNGKPARSPIKPCGGAAFSIRRKRLLQWPDNSQQLWHRDPQEFIRVHSPILETVVCYCRIVVNNYCKSCAEFCTVPPKSRSGDGFCLTLTCMSEKFRFAFQPLVLTSL